MYFDCSCYCWQIEISCILFVDSSNLSNLSFYLFPFFIFIFILCTAAYINFVIASANLVNVATFNFGRA
jgi:hypothetical protein